MARFFYVKYTKNVKFLSGSSSPHGPYLPAKIPVFRSDVLVTIRKMAATVEVLYAALATAQVEA